MSTEASHFIHWLVFSKVPKDLHFVSVFSLFDGTAVPLGEEGLIGRPLPFPWADLEAPLPFKRKIPGAEAAAAAEGGGDGTGKSVSSAGDGIHASAKHQTDSTFHPRN